MLFNIILASVPSALGAAHALKYSPPAALMAKVMADDDCSFPASYEVRNFAGQSNDSSSTLGLFDFEFKDPDTKVETVCHFNESSESSTPSAPNPRYPCENEDIEFIWENDIKKLWLIEGVCPGSDGDADYEASGSTILRLTCEKGGKCSTNSTLHSADFTNISPVRP